MKTKMHLILIQILVLAFVSVGWAVPNKKAKTRVVYVAKKAAFKHKSKKVVVKKTSSKKSLAKKSKTKKPQQIIAKNKKISESRRQAEHARLVAALRKEQNQTPVHKANSEVIIRDYGFEPTPVTKEEKAVMTASITTEDLKLDAPSNAPYIDGTAVYVERSTASSTSSEGLSFDDASDEDLGFED